MLSGLRCVYVFLRLIAFKLHFRGGMLGEMKYVLVGDHGLTEWIGAFTLLTLFSKTGFSEGQGTARRSGLTTHDTPAKKTLFVR